MQASNLKEVGDIILAFDAVMKGKFKEEIERLELLKAEWDARSTLAKREQDLAVREGVLARERGKLDAENAVKAEEQERLNLSMAKREAELSTASKELSLKQSKAAADRSALDAERVVFEQTKGRESAAVNEERRALATRMAEVEAIKVRLVTREAEILKFQKAMAQLPNG